MTIQAHRYGSVKLRGVRLGELIWIGDINVTAALGRVYIWQEVRQRSYAFLAWVPVVRNPAEQLITYENAKERYG